MNRTPAKKPRLRLTPKLYEDLRQHVLCRDGWRCQSCGAMLNLEVHHKEFRSQPGDAPGSELPAQKSFYEGLRKLPSRDVLVVDSKDVEEKLAAAAIVLRATYAYPFQMHGSIGASCAVADVKRDRATVWSATQSVYPTRSIVAKLLGLHSRACASSTFGARAVTD